MRKTKILTILGAFSLLIGLLFITPFNQEKTTELTNETLYMNPIIYEDEITSLYNEMQLNGKINYDAFKQGVTGFQRIESKNKNILALIDFTKPSTEERLFIFDLDKKEILFTTHVSHGKNSGENYATSFSNINGSYQSSLGFFVTENTYQGRNGYSLRLEGLETGINDCAKERAIVMHGAPYSNPSVIASNGRLGRSLGCPAIPEALTRSVIDTLKEGAVLYIFADHPEYVIQSSFL